MKKLFQKSKLKNLYFGGFLFIIAAVFVVSCAKNDETTLISTAKNNTLTATSREGQVAPHVENGMLSFNSYSDANIFVADLKEKEQNQELVIAAYAQLGIDAHAEEIPNVTDNPVCLTTEMNLGHVSARKMEETSINEKLNAGIDVFSIVHDPYWKTILNRDYAVHIGSRIYKYYDNGAFVIVLNNDWGLYESIKTKQFDEIREAHNLVITSDTRADWDKYFVLDSDGDILTEKVILIPRTFSIRASNGKMQILNYSLVESNPTYTWHYSNGSTSVGVVPDRLIDLNEPTTLVIEQGNGTVTTVDAMPVNCVIKDFAITTLSNGSVRFEWLGGNIPGFPNMLWTFSNGTTSTANPFTMTNATNGTATLSFKSSDGVGCSFSKPFFVKCGNKGNRTESDLLSNGGQTWKLDSEIWVKDKEVGCGVKYLRRRVILGQVIFVPAVSGAVSTGFSGTYLRENKTPNGVNCNSVFASNSKGFMAGNTFPTSFSATISDPGNIFKDPGNFSSFHSLGINGVPMGPGVTLPRLVLN
jgi:hypothetical protein